MSRRRSKKKKGMNPAFAVVAFLASAGYVAKVFLADGTPTGLGPEVAVEDPDMGDDGMAEEGTVDWQDLLAVHGSFDGRKNVRLAFSVLESGVTGAAPAGEVAIGMTGQWAGDDPPMMRLGVVMISEKSRRAVLGGQVVGVGDQIGQGEIISIEPGEVRLRWRDRMLTYDLDGEAPIEFRAELQRREQQRQDEQGDDGESTEQAGFGEDLNGQKQNEQPNQNQKQESQR